MWLISALCGPRQPNAWHPTRTTYITSNCSALMTHSVFSGDTSKSSRTNTWLARSKVIWTHYHKSCRTCFRTFRVLAKMIGRRSKRRCMTIRTSTTTSLNVQLICPDLGLRRMCWTVARCASPSTCWTRAKLRWSSGTTSTACKRSSGSRSTANCLSNFWRRRATSLRAKPYPRSKCSSWVVNVSRLFQSPIASTFMIFISGILRTKPGKTFR